MELSIWERWFCSVGSPCITEAIPWSKPSHRAEKWLFWKFGVGACYMCKVVLKFPPSQSGCSASAANRQHITGLSIYDRLWPVFKCFDGLYLKKSRSANCVLLAAFWDRISIFHLGRTENRSARGDGPLCAPHRSTERSRFPPPRLDFCSAGSPCACHVFEWAITRRF